VSRKIRVLGIRLAFFIIGAILFAVAADVRGVPQSIYVSILVCACVVFAYLAWWHGGKDLAPNYLILHPGPYFDRNGLGFCFATEVEGGSYRLVVIYQNRYNHPCDAVVALQIRDDPFTFESRYEFSLKFNCLPGACGKASKLWDYPSDLGGIKLTLRIGADVRYVGGRGLLLRSNEGREVGSTSGKGEAVLAMVGFIGLLAGHLSIHRPPHLSVILPSNPLPRPNPEREEAVRNEVMWKYGDAALPASLRPDSPSRPSTFSH